MKDKTLSVENSNDAKEKISDIKFVGNPDTFKLLCKASSEEEGWMKSTKVMEVDNGCIIQVSTQQRNPDGSYSLAEAITFASETKIKEKNNKIYLY